MILTPLKSTQWDYWKAAHLLHRAGFGGTTEEVAALQALGPNRAVGSLLQGRRDEHFPAPEWAVPENMEMERLAMRDLGGDEEARRLARQERQKRDRVEYLQFVGGWLDRMIKTRDPATEKLMLFWHGHFATSQDKVRDPYYLWLQSETLRTHAMGDFPSLVKAILRDPAMLLYLDGDSSRAGSPNENFAREVMELFTIGVGHYTETDVQEAARAFTGFRINPANQSSRFAPLQHDDGVKTLFGKRGHFDGDQAIDLIVQQRSCAPFMSRKLLAYYVTEQPSQALVDAFATELVRQKFHLRPALYTLFRSAVFYSPDAVQVKGPVEWLVGSVRRMGGELPPYNVSFEILSQLGQIPYRPPNVKGWDGGKNWITTSTLLARYNHAAMLCGAEPMSRGGNGKPRWMSLKLLAGMPEETRAQPAATIDYFAKALFMRPLSAHEKEPFEQFLQGKQGEPATLVRLLHLMMSTPLFQLS